MEAACRGAKEAGGITVGVLPGFSREDANPFVDVAIVTGLSHARNAIVARSSDAVVAITGGYGTLTEIGFALQLGIPVIGLDTWKLEAPIVAARNAQEAVAKAFESTEGRRSPC
jgi:uncharacterized protein (TIGR00725 family)